MKNLKIEKLDALFDDVANQKIDIETALDKVQKIKQNYVNDDKEDSAADANMIERYTYNEPCLRDHQIQGQQILIGAIHGSLAIRNYLNLNPSKKGIILKRLSYSLPIVVEENQSIEVDVLFDANKDHIDFKSIYKLNKSSKWVDAANGKLEVLTTEKRKIDLQDLLAGLVKQDNHGRLFELNKQAFWGEYYKTIIEMYVSENRTLTKVSLEPSLSIEDHAYKLHPLVSNAALIGVFPILENLNIVGSFLPFGIKEVIYYDHDIPNIYWIDVKIAKHSSEIIIFDADIIDPQGEIVVAYSGYSMKRIREADEKPPIREKKIVKNDSVAANSPSLINTKDTDKSVQIENYLKEKLLESNLNKSQLEDTSENIMSLGLESAQLVALVDEINQETGADLSATLFFEYPSISDVTAFFLAEHIDDFSFLWPDIQSSQSNQVEPSDDIDQTNEPDRQAVSTGSTGDFTKRVSSFLTEYLSRAFPELLDGVQVEDNLMEMGLASAQLVELTTDLGLELEIELEPTLFFEYPNIEELSKYLYQDFKDHLSDKLAISTQDTNESAKPERKLYKDNISENRTKKENRAGEDDDIAIIGMHGLFAESSSLEEFWENIKSGRNLIKEIPLDHWDYRPWFDPDPEVPNKTYCKWGSFINDVDKFDAGFFKISPREADWMDPQLRLLLQSIYATAEDAGYVNQLRGSDTGVFVGVCFHDYLEMMSEKGVEGDPYIGTGNGQTVTANRVSFYFDLKGPSIAVNTACSSSLFALHSACQAIKNNECKMAFVSGVNLLFASSHYRYFSSIGALSPTGRCHSFDDAADGYVPGEAVASIMLKPLSQAKLDGDQIYGIVKGSAGLHGGYTPSLTAPSVVGEENVLLKAWESAGVEPETITYIEAHGTGTKLGDPIEINSLKKAFKKHTKKKDFCYVGSAKSHIGHVEGASGIAGIIKVIMQMRHQYIPAMPLFKKLNSFIQLKNSPIKINSEPLPWVTEESVPRRAGVSSFGFSGAYAHVVLEEYTQVDSHEILDDVGPYLIVLSAKTEEVLHQLASTMLKAFESGTYKNEDIQRIAYMLQLCREPKEYRIGILCTSLEDLIAKLSSFCNNEKKNSDVYVGHNRQNKDLLSIFSNDEDAQSTIDQWRAKKKFGKILDLWVKGVKIEWAEFYRGRFPRKISLPTYTFAKERYWVPEEAMNSLANNSTGNVLNQLLHQNISDLTCQRFQSRFDGTESFYDYRLNNVSSLSCGSSLSLLLLAFKRSIERMKDENDYLSLTDLSWNNLEIDSNERQDIIIEVIPKNEGVTITSISEGDVIASSVGYLKKGDSQDQLNISEIRSSISSTVGMTHLYESLNYNGISFGDRLKRIEEVFVDDNLSLAKIQPSNLGNEVDLVAALDSSVALSIYVFQTFTNRAYIPDSIEELKKLELEGEAEWVFVRLIGENKTDVFICDCNGLVLLEIRGLEFSANQSLTKVDTRYLVSGDFTGLVTAVPCFVESSPKYLTNSKNEKTNCLLINSETNHLEYCSEYFDEVRQLSLSQNQSIDKMVGLLRDYNSCKHIVWIPSEKIEIDIQVGLQRRVYFLFKLIKALIQVGFETQSLEWTVMTTSGTAIDRKDDINPIHAAIHGLLGSVAKEYRHWKFRLIDLDQIQYLPKNLFNLECNQWGNPISLRKGIWYQQELRILNDATIPEVVGKEDGAYVIIGGAGGIGVVYSEYLIKNFGCNVVWIGRRSKQSSAIQKDIDRLGLLGPAPQYLEADATDVVSLEEAYRKIKESFGKVRSVIHAAIVLSDSSIANMDEEGFYKSFKTKADVSINIASVFSKEPLDSILFFSSIISFVKTPGQCNYAAGSVFKDAYAHFLRSKLSCPVKVMNWGYWGDTGIVSSDLIREKMLEVGIDSIQPNEGMSALDKLTSSAFDQMVLLKTTKNINLDGIGWSSDKIEVLPNNTKSLILGVLDGLSDQEVRIQNLNEKSKNVLSEIEEIVVKLLWIQLDDFNLFEQAEFRINDLYNKSDLSFLNHKWMEETLELLVLKGFLKKQNDLYQIVTNINLEESQLWDEWELKKEEWLQNSQIKGQVKLLDVMLKGLPTILSGNKSATDFMFPDSSMELLEGVYAKNDIVKFYNDVLAEAVKLFVQKRIESNPTAKLKILEIGAGTGSTTMHICKELEAYEKNIKTYCFTDLSTVFLQKAKIDFGNKYSYFDYKIFNVEISPSLQGMSDEKFDIIIASNVIHATSNINNSLKNAKEVLTNKGIFILNEFSLKSIFTHLTFGLLEGWWLYKDAEIRMGGCPGLYPQQWQNALEKVGFREVSFAAEKAHELGQQIILSESDGVVYKKLQSVQPKILSPKRQNKLREKAKRKPVISKKVMSQSETPSNQELTLLAEAFLMSKLSEVLRIDQNKIDVEIPFADYGLDSISGIKLIQLINNDLGIELNTTQLFDHSSVKQLGVLLCSNHNALITQLGTTSNVEQKVLEQGIYSARPAFSIIDRGQELTVQNSTGKVKSVATIIVNKLSAILRLDPKKIDNDISFADYGLDSISSVKLVREISQTLNIEIDSTAIFDYSSVNLLSDYILSEFEVNVSIGTKSEISIQEHKDISSSIKKSIVEKAPIDFRQGWQKKSMVKSENTGFNKLDKEPIALVGISGRFASAKSLDELWECLENGHDLVKPVARWKPSDFREGENHPEYYGGFLENIDKFDPLFFNINGLEATYMDPQQRFFLEESWSALENAGYAGVGNMETRCGVYVGCSAGSYHDLFEDDVPPQAFWGNAGSIIPARIAYYLNLDGPAIAVDTACSSSLVAIHLACQGLWSRETDMALAGGVFIQSTPWFYESGSKAGMLSASGKCHTFDESADGFVPGEGVGVVVLKRLSEAVRDNDYIHGVIKATGINQDGTTNGITAPSSNAQANLETEIYESFGINPESIQMVEAHGTGTILGDPIEFNALKRAFRKFTQKEDFCSLGSIKTNIGHAAAAAGVAGLFKILLSFKNDKIPASLNYNSGNPNIQFSGSPFYVNTQLSEWKSSPKSKRRAALSAFGFSGTNAHMVIEDAPVIPISNKNKKGYLILISARRTEQLKHYISDYLEFFKKNKGLDLSSVEYTTIVGRKHFSHRFACVVTDQSDLVNTLDLWLKNEPLTFAYTNEILYGDLIENQETASKGNSCILRCASLVESDTYFDDLVHIADLFSRGYALNYNDLFVNVNVSKIPLPTYPFAKEKYWVADSNVKKNINEIDQSGSKKILHPLVHENISLFSNQSFSSSFSGAEFFFSDHIINGQKILPAVAYLEMARFAYCKSRGYSGALILKNIVWIAPVIADISSIGIKIDLNIIDNDDVHFKIYTRHHDLENIRTHCEGVATLQGDLGGESVDLIDIRERCQLDTLKGERFYEICKSFNFNYGQSFRCLAQLYLGEKEIFAELQLPQSEGCGFHQPHLHPGMLDAALQSSVGLALANDIEGEHLEKTMPFALGRMKIVKSLSEKSWVHVKLCKESSAKVQKIDIDIYDDQGDLCVKMEKYAYRIIEERSGVPFIETNNRTEYFTPIWEQRNLVANNQKILFDSHVIILCGFHSNLIEKVKSSFVNAEILVLDELVKGQEQNIIEHSVLLFNTVKRLLAGSIENSSLLQIVVRGEGAGELYKHSLGLLKTAQLESPSLQSQVIQVSENIQDKTIVEILQEEGANQKQLGIVKYDDRKRYVSVLRNSNIEGDLIISPWKDNGVYLIVGGAGGIGKIVSQDILKNTKSAKVVIVGRRAVELHSITMDQAQLSRIEYVCCDITDFNQVESLISKLLSTYNKINGCFHCAGIVDDSFIQVKTEEEVRGVLTPKILGALNLDKAIADKALDFFVMFGAGAGVFGNLGQADYAMGNAFLDAFSYYRNHSVKDSLRQGKTITIDWPLWMNGGMQIPNELAKRMESNIGLFALNDEEALKSLYACLNSELSQIVVLHGEQSKIQEVLKINEVEKEFSLTEKASTEIVSDKDVYNETLLLVRNALSNLIKISPDRIERKRPFEKYGLDSIMQMNLITELENVYGVLPKTLLFEYSTLEELVVFLSKKEVHTDNIKELSEENGSITKESFNNHIISNDTDNQDLPLGPPSKNGHSLDSRIAIIGMSGSYPNAPTMEDLWEKLKEGKNCITKAPRLKWKNSLEASLERDNEQNYKEELYGGFIEESDKFDIDLFEFTEEEALELSPETRLFLETAWRTFEDGGYNIQSLKNLEITSSLGVGVFVGTMYNQYPWMIPSFKDAVQRSNGTEWEISNRVSHFFDITGPSIALNTACSGSATAIHLACQSLKNKECSMAIAGGVNLTLEPSKYDSLKHTNFLGSGDKCMSFGDGDGYLPGEGVGAVLLKPLEKAIEDNDQIYGVIINSATSHSGGRQMYRAPNPKQQSNLIYNVIKNSGINPETISYVESAANGSGLGDAIEVMALCDAFRKFTDKEHFCALGSVKSNIGHLEAASGISQLSKVLLQLKYQKLVPSINASPRNPNIRLESSPFYIQNEYKDWLSSNSNTPRRSLVNSFGAGGAYTCFIIEEYKNNRVMIDNVSDSNLLSFIFSAKTRESLVTNLQKMNGYIASNDSLCIGSLASSLLLLNNNLEHRLLLRAQSKEELMAKFEQLLNSKDIHQIRDVLVVNLEMSGRADVEDDVLEKLYHEENIPELLNHWIKGVDVNFAKFVDRQFLNKVSDRPKFVFDHSRTIGFDNVVFPTGDEIQDSRNRYLANVLDKVSSGELTEDEFENLILTIEL